MNTEQSQKTKAKRFNAAQKLKLILEGKAYISDNRGSNYFYRIEDGKWIVTQLSHRDNNEIAYSCLGVFYEDFLVRNKTKE